MASADVALSQVHAVRLDLIDPPSWRNPRSDFDDVESLAESIGSVGLLQAITLRPNGEGRFELVAGDRRLQAVRSLGWQTVPANVRELDDRQAAEVRLLENLDREDLNPVEEADAFRQLQDLGHGLQSIAELTRLTEETVQNRMTLLQLPTAWQDCVRRGELSAAAAGYLVPWREYDAVLDAVEPALQRWPMPLTQWKRELVDAVVSVSRSMAPADDDGPAFDVKALSDDQAAELQCVTLRPTPRCEMPRAMNVELWDRLQADARASGDGGDSARNHAGGNTPANGRDNAGERRQRAAQDASGRDDGSAAAEPVGSLEERVRAWHRPWLIGAISDRLPSLRLAELQDLAQECDVDYSAHPVPRDLLEALAEDELRSVCGTLEIDASACADADEVRAVVEYLQPDLDRFLDAAARVSSA